ncbi:MAG: type IX secretion system outer membrane channel protein PorV [Paludibacteraceae bacterium]|nr:type IX secretion system outer membrane channel protein PorV [Paludibacteraceae bacterium]
MKKKRLALVSLCVLGVANSVAVAGEKENKFNPLQSAVPSLSIAPDARGGGMGDVGVATSPDINSQYWNPAKYAHMESHGGFSLSYTPWLRKIVNDIDLVYLGGYYKLDDLQALSASFRYFSMGEINLTQAPGPDGQVISDGTCNPYEMSFDLAYSRKLSENWSAAVALRFIYSDLTNGMTDDETVTAGKAMAADVAAYYRKPIELGGEGNKPSYASFGINISNIGSKVSYDDGETNQFIPTNLRLGGSFEYPFDDFNSVSLSVDLNKLLVPTPPKLEQGEGESEADFQKRQSDAWDDYYNTSPVSGIFKSFTDAPGGGSEELEEIMWSVGAEYSYNKQFLVRAGYFHESENKGNRKYWAFGAGFNLSIFQLNAAYLMSTAQTSPLDQTLRFTLGFDIAGLKGIMNNSKEDDK